LFPSITFKFLSLLVGAFVDGGLLHKTRPTLSKWFVAFRSLAPLPAYHVTLPSRLLDFARGELPPVKLAIKTLVVQVPWIQLLDVHQLSRD
jgi:hypothetical protein